MPDPAEVQRLLLDWARTHPRIAADATNVAPTKRSDPVGQAVTVPARMVGQMVSDAVAHPLDTGARILAEPYDWVRSAWDAGAALGQGHPGEAGVIALAGALPGITGAAGKAIGREAGVVERAANPYAHVPEPGRIYHGTRHAFEAFDDAVRGSTTGAPSAHEAMFFTSRPETAGDYAMLGAGREGAAPNVRPARVALENPAVVDFGGRDFHEEEATDALRRAKAAGHDGVVFTNVVDGVGPISAATPSDVHAVFDRSRIRSPWGDWGSAGQVGALLGALGLGTTGVTPLARQKGGDR